MGGGRILNLDEKQALYNDGYVILKKVIPDKILKEARNALTGHISDFDKRLGYDSRMTDLINQSSLNSILSEAIGNFAPQALVMSQFENPQSQANNSTMLGIGTKNPPIMVLPCIWMDCFPSMTHKKPSKVAPKKFITDTLLLGQKVTLGAVQRAWSQPSTAFSRSSDHLEYWKFHSVGLRKSF